ncbi:hypothetical protein GCM10022421_16250 [Oceanisphaera sediminis]|uniref:Uncharacterized protein n=1 Tax=Oceanisphaera sediminis TaxID=981381 RepID=A0ABP7DTW5_9GAMM
MFLDGVSYEACLYIYPFLIPNILNADEYTELEQRFNRNVSQYMLSVFGGAHA